MNVCEQCGQEFKPTRGANRVQKYCSSVCFHRSRAGIPVNKPVEPVIVVCAWCGKEFETGGRGRPPKDQRFCSKACQAYTRVREHHVKEMSIAQAAYLAGLVDGEGSIIATQRNSKGRHTWRLQVANTQMVLLDWCIEATGVGTIVTTKRKSEKHQDGHWWQCYSWNAYDVLRQIAPYMTIKKDLALRMMAELDEVKRIAAGS
jgi:hypothetical protein